MKNNFCREPKFLHFHDEESLQTLGDWQQIGACTLQGKENK